MFSQVRKNVITQVLWDSPYHSLIDTVARWIEVWKVTDDDGRVNYLSDKGELRNNQVAKWVAKEDGLKLHNLPQGSHVTGGLRVVFCERRAGEIYDLSLPLSEESYGCLETGFHLDPGTLPIFHISNGAFYSHSNFQQQGLHERVNIAVVIKACQKVQLGTFGVSLFHNFKASITTAFILAEPLSKNEYWCHLVRESLDIGVWNTIQAAPQNCLHPLFLPTMLLNIHVHRSADFVVRFSGDRLYDIEERMGVSRAGVLGGIPAQNPLAEKTVLDAQKNTWSLLVELNTRLTDTLFMIKVSDWQTGCVSFLIETMQELEAKTKDDFWSEQRNALHGMASYLKSTIQSVSNYGSQQRSRAQTQLDALYLFQSQLDNFLSAHLAESAGHDGIAMKTLAFVTTLFLPATFVATLFSMSMFDWMAPSAPSIYSSLVVSTRFWIYWAVTIPLMVIVVSGWALWQRSEHKRYKREIWESRVVARGTTEGTERAHLEVARPTAHLHALQREPDYRTPRFSAATNMPVAF